MPTERTCERRPNARKPALRRYDSAAWHRLGTGLAPAWHRRGKGRSPVRIVVVSFMSLDGVVQAPNRPDEDTDGGFAHGGWSHRFYDPEVMGPVFGEAMQAAGALLFGKHTWQAFAAAWSGRSGDMFANLMNALPKYVVSSTLGDEDLTWNTQRIPGDGVVA